MMFSNLSPELMNDVFKFITWAHEWCFRIYHLSSWMMFPNLSPELMNDVFEFIIWAHEWFFRVFDLSWWMMFSNLSPELMNGVFELIEKSYFLRTTLHLRSRKNCTTKYGSKYGSLFQMNIKLVNHLQILKQK